MYIYAKFFFVTFNYDQLVKFYCKCAIRIKYKLYRQKSQKYTEMQR